MLATAWLLTTCPTDDGFVCGVLTGLPPVGRVRLTEVDRRAGRVDLVAAERDEIADDGAEHEAGGEQPPTGTEQPDVAREVHFLLGLGVEAPLRGSRRSHEGRR